MLRLLVIALLMLCSANFALAGDPQIMKSEYPSDDLVIAQFNVRQAPYNAAGDGKADDTAAFQRAIDDAADLKGAVVYAPAGTYRFDGQLRLKAGVTIRGDWLNPKTSNGTVKGTILAVYADHGNEAGQAFITMEKVSCVRNLSFWYPMQKPDSIVPYPWTIDLTDMSSCGYTVKNVTFVNSYNAFSSGAVDGRCYNVGLYSNIYGTPLKNGIWIDYCLDISRVERIYFSAKYWMRSGLPSAPTSRSDIAALKKSLLDNATGITIRGADWAPIYLAEIDGYGVGINLGAKPDTKKDSNGEMYAVRVTGSRTALKVDSVQFPAWLISRCIFRSIDEEDAAGIRCSPQLKHLIQLNTCTVSSIKIEKGSEGAVSLENCTLEKPLYADGGMVSLINSKFTGTGTQLFLGRGCTNILLAGCEFDDESEAIQAANSSIIRREAAPSIVAVPDRTYPFPAAPSPSSDALYNVRDFGAKGDETTDDTKAFESALAKASVSGGTVYIPAGRYRITKPLTVPAGVELRGIFEGPTHPMIPGSCLLVETGHGEENGIPFISLDPGSGIRGLVIWYPKQDLRNLVPYPWTIRALGKRCWVKDVSIGNPWQAVDFASVPDTSGHFIAGLNGSPMRRGLFVDNSHGKGYVENPHFIIHYWSRNDSKLVSPTGGDGIKYMGDNLEAFKFGRCDDEFIMGSFVYATKTGLVLHDGFKGTVHLHGSDAAGTGLLLTGKLDVTLVNTNCAPFTGKHPVSFHLDDTFTGKAKLLNSSCWAAAEGLRIDGTGRADVSQLNAEVVDSWVSNPNARVTGIYGVHGHTIYWDPGCKPNPAVCFARCESVATPFKGRIVSRQCAVTSDSDHSDYENAARAVDGGYSIWVSNEPGLHWLELDLGREYNITGIEIIHLGALKYKELTTRDFSILGRNNPSDEWRTLAEIIGNTSDRTRTPFSAKYRFIRLQIIKPAQVADNYARIAEISVYGE